VIVRFVAQPESEEVKDHNSIEPIAHCFRLSAERSRLLGARFGYSLR
jgi:hypothetical protein